MFKLFLINRLRYKNNNSLLSIVFVIVTVIFLLFICMSKGMNYIVNTKCDNPELREIMVSPIDRNKYNYISIDDEFLKIIASKSYVASIVSPYRYDVGEEDNVSFKIGDEDINILFELSGYDFEYNIFNNLDLIVSNIDQAIISGNSNLRNIDDILIDENIVHLLGYTVDDAIGQKIEFKYNDITYELNIIGVYDKRISSGSYSIFDFENDCPDYVLEDIHNIGVINPFLFSKEFLFSLAGSLVKPEDVIIEVESVDDVYLIHDYIEKNTSLFVNSSIGQIKSLQEEIEKYSVVVLLICISIGASIVLISMNNISLKIYRQRDFIAILDIMGCEKKSVILLFFLETLYTLFTITIMYSFIAYLLSFAVDSALKVTYQQIIGNITGVFVLDFKVLLLFIFSYSLLFVIFSITSILLSVNNIYLKSEVIKHE